MTHTVGYASAKQRFTVQVKHGVEQLIREAIALHPVLRRLPVRDRENAARCGTRHLLLAIRSEAVDDVLDQIDHEAFLDRFKLLPSNMPQSRPSDAAQAVLIEETMTLLHERGITLGDVLSAAQGTHLTQRKLNEGNNT